MCSESLFKRRELLIALFFSGDKINESRRMDAGQVGAKIFTLKEKDSDEMALSTDLYMQLSPPILAICSCSYMNVNKPGFSIGSKRSFLQCFSKEHSILVHEFYKSFSSSNPILVQVRQQYRKFFKHLSCVKQQDYSIMFRK